MKIIDAFWEKRNLGIDTMEFEIESGDTLENIQQTISANEKQYNVVKVESGNFNIKNTLYKMGYIQAESMFKLVYNSKISSVTPAVKNIADRITYEPMNDDDIEKMFREIERGMFTTDRIALDPHFSVKIANKRYINWIKDEIEKGACLLKGIYENDVFSFSIYKKLKNNTTFAFLGGTYLDYQSFGLAIPATYKNTRTIASLERGKLISYVSSNNYNSLVCDIAAGYIIKGVADVYIKHNK